MLILVVSPSLVTEGTRRIVNHRTAFEDLAPFLFNIQNESLSTVELQDFELVVSLDGKEVPNDLYVEIDGKRTLMNRLSAARFSHVFHQPRENVEFRLNGSGYNSATHTLAVLPKPAVVGFEVSLDFPKYIGRANETRPNSGDLLIPEGTRVTWNISTAKTDGLSLVLGERSHSLGRVSKNGFTYSDQFKASTEYTIVGHNEFMKAGDSLRYTITVVPDL